jgi:hypothetical protein
MRQTRGFKLALHGKILFIILSICILLMFGLSYLGVIKWDTILAEIGLNETQATFKSTTPVPTPKQSTLPEKRKASSPFKVEIQSIGTTNDLQKALIMKADNIQIEPGKLFSLANWVKQISNDNNLKVKDEEISKLGGILFEVCVRLGLEVGERYIHQDLPEYASPGFDVDFQVNKKDFTFYNPYDFSFQLHVKFEGSVPVIVASATPSAKWFLPTIAVVKEIFAPEKIVIEDSKVIGEIIKDSGKTGQMVRVYGDYKEKGIKELHHKDFYAPHPVVVARALKAEELNTVESN